MVNFANVKDAKIVDFNYLLIKFNTVENKYDKKYNFNLRFNNHSSNFIIFTKYFFIQFVNIFVK